jgi:hypothetical protein
VRKALFCCGLLTAAAYCTGPAAAQQHESVEKVRSLVDAGALPRAALDSAIAGVADEQDEAFLNRTLYGTLGLEDTTPADVDAMLAAARRRLERAEAKYNSRKELVELGYLARNELKPLEDELAYRRTTVELADSRAQVLRDLTSMAQAEQAAETPEIAGSGAPRPVRERFDGKGQFGPAEYRRVLLAYERQFNKALPVSAHGDTAIHRALGFDHRGRVDIALSPDQTEGVWLRGFLEQEQIPFFAFRSALPGKATAPHIHLGPPSLRLKIAD